MDLVVATLAERFKRVHEVLRAEIEGMTPEQLLFVPASAVNSVAVLVTHTLGSEAQVWSIAAGRDGSRDRPSEFTNPIQTLDELRALLLRADERIDELAPTIDAAALAREWLRPTDKISRTCAAWLIHNFGHASEHMAHLQLMKQLLPDHYPPLARPW